METVYVLATVISWMITAGIAYYMARRTKAVPAAVEPAEDYYTKLDITESYMIVERRTVKKEVLVYVCNSTGQLRAERALVRTLGAFSKILLVPCDGMQESVLSIVEIDEAYKSDVNTVKVKQSNVLSTSDMALLNEMLLDKDDPVIDRWLIERFGLCAPKYAAAVEKEETNLN